MRKTKFCLLLILLILSLSSLSNVLLVKSQLVVTTVNINADGSIEPATAPIERNGNVYTLTDNISGTIAVHKSNIVIDGAGYALNGNGGTGIDLQNNLTQIPSPDEIWNVTITNLAIINFDFSIRTNAGGNDTLYEDYIANTASGLSGGIFLWTSVGNNITHCCISGNPAVGMDFCSNRNIVTENDLSGPVWTQLSGLEIVDRNYWSDYLTKYPNATEIDSTGIGNTPYVFYSYVYNSSGSFSSPLLDNHPQMHPINIPLFSAASATLPTEQQSSSVPEFPTWVILPFALTIMLLVTILERKKLAISARHF